MDRDVPYIKNNTIGLSDSQRAKIKEFDTKKWYLTCLVRQRLGVPFSGLEFIEHAFL